MAYDVMMLGDVIFDDHSTPSQMGAGGKQAMVIHKLPGGARVIDTLGPDEANINWDGEFFANNALDVALQLDGMRASGKVQTLIFAGQSRKVIIESFSYHIKRLPVWVQYSISCMVYQNASLGDLSSEGSAPTTDSLVQGDLATASSAASPTPAQSLAAGTSPV